ncbi:hypothetical protein [Chryseobacterium oncorhynchi]|uniref:Phosphoadenosine phosphosulphate reductase domain-containing protein n=1 Tax=Chryseobacterium oncorhynchi TaxID=741074 RepID=A0A316X270_9FLAO|nr:hypothetical protein [Chryseobacterium oncorhynchi]PWN67624.1 hypothetical protein C1638_003265 [Chryseobacterium oncorhynchi]
MKKKGLISFSGGETSGFMLWWLLENKSNEYDFTILYANTGRENDATLEFVKNCAEYFGCEIIWVEAVIRFKVRAFGKFKTFTSFEKKKDYLNSFSPEQLKEIEFNKVDKKSGIPIFRMCVEEVDCGTVHRIVTYQTATRNQDWKKRNDTPYEMMVKKYGLANVSNRVSTRELKERPIHSLMKSLGHKAYDTFIGIRVDEFDRMSKERKDLNLFYPLVVWKPFTKQHVNFWWSIMPFRLMLQGWEGNCITCYKKSFEKLMQIMIDDPWKFEFDEYLEKKYGFYIPKKKLIEMFFKGKELPKLPLKIFRENRTVAEIRKMAGSVKKKIKDDSRTTAVQLSIYDDEESCEVFSQCGN